MMDCDRSKSLLAAYVDGELAEALAGPLRKHLMECGACRTAASEAKALASWFVPTAPIAVPAGFAARVAARAAAQASAGAQALGGGGFVLRPAPRGPRADNPAGTARFAMAVAGLAAAVLVGLSLLLASGGGHQGFEERGGLRADEQSLEAELKRLEELNRAAEQRPVSVTPDQAAPPAPR